MSHDRKRPRHSGGGGGGRGGGGGGGGGADRSRVIHVMAFAEERASELAAVAAALRGGGGDGGMHNRIDGGDGGVHNRIGGGGGAQPLARRVPSHERRRTGSHRRYKIHVPVRRRPAGAAAGAAAAPVCSAVPPTHTRCLTRVHRALQAITLRVHRRQAGLPPASVADGSVVRGPLHAWHAKRMTMDRAWGRAVPMAVNDKGVRAVVRVRAAVSRARVWGWKGGRVCAYACVCVCVCVCV